MNSSEKRGGTMVVKEPIGVCALITPWNWPLNQIVCKVAPAIAAGCTVVLKPSEIAPISGIVFSEVMEAAGTPKGVYNMVNGTGPDVGQVMAGHPDVDMVSFTGSTRAGIIVAKTAAETVKRVAQELGGKSANIVLPDADFETAVRKGVEGCFGNSGQSCDAPTRMLVPAARHDEALAIAKKAAEAHNVGDPRSEDTKLGPVVSNIQYDKIQRLIEAGIKEGATLVTGGPGRPEHLNRGYYVRPTVFGHVTPGMTIEKEEIFGPVLSVISYDDDDDAVKIANDTVYGLAAYVQSGDIEHARKVAGQLRAGQVSINYPEWDTFAPVRRLQAVRQRPRICRLGDPRFSRGQGHHRLRGVGFGSLLGSALSSVELQALVRKASAPVSFPLDLFPFCSKILDRVQFAGRDAYEWATCIRTEERSDLFPLEEPSPVREPHLFFGFLVEAPD